MTVGDVRPEAQQGFGAAAQAYVRGRPDYPDAVLGWLRETLGVGAGRNVIELGAGTGKFTRMLLRTGASIIAIEPVDAMRGELQAAVPGVLALAATAQATTLNDAVGDAVVCAQAFHWFASQDALAEIHRVLKPAGALGLIWNVRDESVDWVAATTRILAPYEGDTPRHSRGEWKRAFDGRLFGDLEMSCFPHEHVGHPRQVILDRCLSISFVAALPASEKERVAGQLMNLIASHPALRGRETVAYPYQTHAYACRRRPLAARGG